MSENKRIVCYTTPLEDENGYKFCAKINHDVKTLQFYHHQKTYFPSTIGGVVISEVHQKDVVYKCSKYRGCRKLLYNLRDYSIEDYDGK